jgi:Raf kinase inhibitor-like YbhB/YbcL family protein
MRISSPAFQDGGNIPVKYTCDGENVSPPLAFDDVPPETKSLALIVEDPDAPRGTFTHWVLWGIDPSINNVPENEIPQKARELENDFRMPEYGGPCPPSGTHRYFFRLYALDTIALPPPDAKHFHQAIADHILEETSVMGRYQRAG